MTETEEMPKPVRAKAYLIDPETFKVIWMNESARRELKDLDRKEESLLNIEKVIPLSEMMGISDALPIVSEMGEPRHLHTGIISTRKGTMGLAASLYRLPDAKLLLLIENDWQIKARTRDRR